MFDLILLAAAKAPAAGEAAEKAFGPIEAISEGGPVSWSLAIIMVIIGPGRNSERSTTVMPESLPIDLSPQRIWQCLWGKQ